MPRKRVGTNQWANPAVQKVFNEEMEAIKDILGKVHPKGLPVREMVKKFHDLRGYKLNYGVLAARVNILVDKNEVHRSLQKGKYGSDLYILGPEPKPIGAESKPKEAGTEEPPLAGDELLSFMQHMEGVMSAKALLFEKKLNSLEGYVRHNNTMMTRVLVLLHTICDELGINTNNIPTNEKE